MTGGFVILATSTKMAPSAIDSSKPMNWADDVDDYVSPDAPRIEEKDEGNGVKVITEYKLNPDGKKVKVCTMLSKANKGLIFFFRSQEESEGH